MFRFKHYKVVKGYTIIYVMFLGILCMVMVLIGFKGELEKRKNIQNIISSTLEWGTDMKYREYLFTRFKEKLIEEGIVLNSDSIKNYLDSNYAVFKITYESSILTYDKVKGLMVITYPIDRYYNRMDYYSYTPEGNKMKMSMVHTEVKPK